MSASDCDIICKVAEYCEDIVNSMDRFGKDLEIFVSDVDYQHSTSFAMLQIGELVKRLSDGFVYSYPEIPWRTISGMRDFYAHQYGNVDLSMAWSAISVDIPRLLTFCRSCIKDDC
jgi:uncharacterized protein with HEPN domain